MRVPPLIVLFLCLAVVGGVWWQGSRKADFLTPPSESKLTEIRRQVESSLPRVDHPGDAVTAPHAANEPSPPPSLPQPPKPVVRLGELTRPPGLDEYTALGSEGSAFLVELAVLLETEGQLQRALIAWERVIDTGKPDESQTTAAIAAVKRLRPILPDWNTDPSHAIPISLHADTDTTTAGILDPVLKQTAHELELASSGILKVTPHLTAGPGASATSATTVTLWLAGTSEKHSTTEALSFTVGSSESLNDQARQTVYQILRRYLARETTQTPPPARNQKTPPLEALNTHISRRSWQQLGSTLNRPQ